MIIMTILYVNYYIYYLVTDSVIISYESVSSLFHIFIEKDTSLSDPNNYVINKICNVYIYYYQSYVYSILDDVSIDIEITY